MTILSLGKRATTRDSGVGVLEVVNQMLLPTPVTEAQDPTEEEETTTSAGEKDNSKTTMYALTNNRSSISTCIFVTARRQLKWDP